MRLTITMPENLNKRIENVSENTGLTKSEIARRGILEEIRDLEVENLNEQN